MGDPVRFCHKIFISILAALEAIKTQAAKIDAWDTSTYVIYMTSQVVDFSLS